MVTTEAVEVDVLVVGAGLSGIGAACRLERELPGTTYAVIEAREAIGGTWDLFRYPGVRSDSDMFTLSFSFRPWEERRSIADGERILRYIRTTAAEYGVDRKVRLGQRMVAADWSSADCRWTVTVECTSGEHLTYRCRFLESCTGYYRYDEGYDPGFPGIEDFRGQVVHPQHWPEDLDYAGKRVVVIGSGATAITLVPAMARTAGHVTMLQRTPTYVISLPAVDRIAVALRRWLPAGVAHRLIRAKNVALTNGFYQFCRSRPEWAKRLLRRQAARALPPDFDLDTHLTPPYNPWDQRLCVIPDGDLYQAVSTGRASIVTDHIERFTPTGIRLRSGTELPADVVVTATGLNLLVLGGARLSIDGREVSLPDTVSYRGAMLTGVPNLTMAVGYINASWALKAELISEWTCRLLRYLDEHGYAAAVPREPGPEVPRLPLFDLTAGYVLRSAASLPKRTPQPPWVLAQRYRDDIRMLRKAPVDDGVLEFVPAPSRSALVAA